MSNKLELTASEIKAIQTSWERLQASNRKHKDHFTSRLYSNLIKSHPQYKTIFDDSKVLKEHSTLFGEILSFIVLYKHDPETLNDFMYQFVHENQRFANVTVLYLEPMGESLIDTFKQWLGDSVFTIEFESVWIKTYVFVANSLLQYSDSDDEASEAESTFSPQLVESEADVSDNEDIRPLNIKRNGDSSLYSTPEPVDEPVIAPIIATVTPKNTTKAPASVLDKSNSIQFTLGSNDKYRGFRRSLNDNIPKNEPISVKIPQSSNFSKTHSHISTPNISSSLKSVLESSPSSTIISLTSGPTFDPRKQRRSRSVVNSSASSINEEFSPAVESFEQPIITPRSARRNSNASEKPLPEAPVQQKKSLSYQPSLLRKLEQKQSSASSEVYSDEEFEVKSKFDPRKSRGHKRTNSIHIPSPESSEVDETDETELFNPYRSNFAEEFDEEKQIDINPQIPSTSSSIPERSLSRGGLTGGTFDYNSFGLKGLAPIVENEFDDGASSKYNSDEDNVSSSYCADESNKSLSDQGSSDQGSSSRASSLSLHNSDYKSSISSGTDSASNSPFMNGKFQPDHQTRHSSGSSDISYMKSLSDNTFAYKTYSSSTPSLLLGKDPTSFSKRASVGFMRSSFVLKKEMEEFGLDRQDSLSKTLSGSGSTPNLARLPQNYNRRAATTISIPESDCDDEFDMFRSFGQATPIQTKPIVHNQYKSMNFTNIAEKAKENAPFQQAPPVVKEKKSFKKRISSMFSYKSSTSSASVSPVTTSVASPSVYASTISKKTSKRSGSTYDLTSINTNSTKGTTVSGFSFFKQKKNDSKYNVVHRATPRKGNKYQVKAAAYDLDLFK